MTANDKKKIMPNGFWECDDPTQYKFDVNIASMLATFFGARKSSVLDLGCGNGAYVNYWREAGIEAIGADGNPHTPEIAGPYCGVADLTVAQHMPLSDWVVCLEVAEHIPKIFEPELIFNLHNNNREGIVLSWAIPGQGGHGHVNERTNEYVRKIFAQEYEELTAWTDQLRGAAYLPWLKNTIMVFARKEKAKVADKIQKYERVGTV